MYYVYVKVTSGNKVAVDVSSKIVTDELDTIIGVHKRIKALTCSLFIQHIHELNKIYNPSIYFL